MCIVRASQPTLGILQLSDKTEQAAIVHRYASCCNLSETLMLQTLSFQLTLILRVLSMWTQHHARARPEVSSRPPSR
jgi:hypothetical protein